MNRPTLLAFASLSALATTPALAQDSADHGAADEIIVTAQKRSETLQSVPAAISALGPAQLGNAGITQLADLRGLVPNLETNTRLGSTFIYVRGIGTNELGIGADSSIAVHIDGVYVARPRAQGVGFFDVERIEVLRGPQGDLYGRNATGGALNIITREPTDEFSARFEARAGTYGTLRVEGAVGGPIAGDAMTGRIAAYSSKHNGYGKNLVTGSDVDGLNSWGVRGKLRLRPADRLQIDLSADKFVNDDTTGGSHVIGSAVPGGVLTSVRAGGILPTDPRDMNTQLNSLRDQDAWSLSGTASLELSDSLTLKSISGYRRSTSYLQTDLSGTQVKPALLVQYENQRQFSQEVQALLSLGRFEAIFGGYYFKETIDGRVNVDYANYIFPGAKFLQSGTNETRAYAAFMHASYELTDKLKVITGLRYSDEQRKSVGSFLPIAPPALVTGGQKSWSALTPTLKLQYDFSRDVMTYLSASRGFKSGAFVLGSAGAPVNPEYVWSYEGGVKADLLNGLAQLNAAAFYYRYTDLVVSIIRGTTVSQENAAAAGIKGAEAELTLRPTDQLRLNASVGYLDAKYNEFVTGDPLYPALPAEDLKGRRLIGAAKWNLSARAEYRAPVAAGDILLSGSVRYLSRTYFTPQNAINLSRDPHAIADARLAYKANSGWELAAFVTNLFDKRVISSTSAGAAVLGFPINATFNEPRIIGVEAKYSL